MAKTYLTKAAIKPVGVSKVRDFGGPVDLLIEDKTEGVIDNFPMGLTVDDLFGAIIKVDNGTRVKKYAADGVYESEGKIYFSLGANAVYYDKVTGRVNIDDAASDL